MKTTGAVVRKKAQHFEIAALELEEFCQQTRPPAYPSLTDFSDNRTMQ
ncbi:MAG TPA: hypothetical protein VGL94_21055 [Ktedonobacteraceae bacterium]|jgi:hypothetical protein